MLKKLLSMFAERLLSLSEGVLPPGSVGVVWGLP